MDFGGFNSVEKTVPSPFMTEKRIFSPDKILQPPKLVDGIFEVSLRLQTFWWVQKIVRTRNGFALTDILANQTKFRVVRTGQADKHLTHLSPKTNFKGAVFLNESMNERTNERTSKRTNE